MADDPQTIRLERLETGETWDYTKGKPRKTYVYVCKLGNLELYRDTNPAFAGAIKKGYEAAENGEARQSNPFKVAVAAQPSRAPSTSIGTGATTAGRPKPNERNRQ